MSKSLRNLVLAVSLLAIVIAAILCVMFFPKDDPEQTTNPVILRPTEYGAEAVTYPKLSDYDGINAYVELNGNMPSFSDEEKARLDAFETYSELDSLGRCGVAYANICQDIMPTEERGEIGSVTPSGWQSIKMDFVDGGYLYNRCHLIGFQLAGENANEKNLITGTRYLNIEGMLGLENQIADYVESTGNHVLYRVTPVFNNKNLVANGVQMEAWSVEDNGEGVCFNVFAYNVQPGVKINYADGTAKKGRTPASKTPITDDANTSDADTDPVAVIDQDADMEYILNTNSGKFHLPECDGVGKMTQSNQRRITGTMSDIIAQGYEPCGACLLK